MNILKRMCCRVFKSLISIQGPAFLTLLFAVALFYFFPDGPLWLVGVFAIFITYMFSRYIR